MSVETTEIDFAGRAGARRLTNGEVELVVTADVGPRILRYGFVGGPNLFIQLEREQERGITGDAPLRLYGGHRIWVGPEDRGYTHAADNAPVDIAVDGRRLQATAPVDAAGIEKTLEVEMAATGSNVTVRHQLRNASPWPLRLAPWALSMMAPSGVGFARFPPRGTHPEDLAPSNPLVMWAFTHLTDPRWLLLDRYLGLRQDPSRSRPEKLGLFHPQTRAGYLLGDQLFVKKYDADPEAEYPDMGASFEIFANDLFLELETLGPLRTVAAGQTAEHTERWSLHRGVRVDAWTDDGLDAGVGRFLE